jgi:hypothetical protein
MSWEHGAAPRRRRSVGSGMGARQREGAKARIRPPRRSKGSVGGRKQGLVSVSTIPAFFRVIAFSRLPEMFWEHGATPQRRGSVGSGMGARQRERAKSRNRPPRRSKGSVGRRKQGLVSVSTIPAFFRVIAFSRLPVMFWEHGTAPRRRGSAADASRTTSSCHCALASALGMIVAQELTQRR